MSVAEKIKKHVGMGVADQRYVCRGCKTDVEFKQVDAEAGSKALGELGWRHVFFEKYRCYGLACPKCTDEQLAIAS